MDHAISHIGAALRYVRHTLRLKIELVAQEAGCAPSNLSRIENGRQRPSVPLLEALARALHTSVSELYGLVEAGVPPAAGANTLHTPFSSRDWLEIRRRLDALATERRRQVLEFLDHAYEAQLRERQPATDTRDESDAPNPLLARHTGT